MKQCWRKWILLGLMALPLWMGQAEAATPKVHFSHASIIIQTADGQNIRYSVELAKTQQQHEHGLMFRRSMPKKTGMLFLFDPDFDPANGQAFWMKDTKISLDMLFVRDDGTIVEVHPRAKPNDLTRIEAPEAVRAVVEINGGEAESLGIKAGDRVIYPGLARNKP